jgi:excisionase family DNA binding protein
MANKKEKTTFISIAELAKILGISRIAVFNKIKRGQIPAERIGRSYAISMDDVSHIIHGPIQNVLTEDKKKDIGTAVEKVVREYGEALKLLGKE